MSLVYMFIAALLISIILGFALKINIGYIAIAFAFINGLFFYGFSVKQVVGMWPLSLFMMLLMVMLFYGFAIANGTVESLAGHIAYSTRKVPYLLPFALWLFCLVIAASGAGPYAVFAFLSPIVMGISIKSGMRRLLAAVIVITGGSIGGQFPISAGGIVIKNYATMAGYEALASSIALDVFINTLIGQGLIFLGMYIVLKGFRLTEVNMEKPEPLNQKQKITLGIIVFVLALTVLPALLAMVFPGSALFKVLKGFGDVTATSAIGIILCLFFRVGKEKDAINKVPWNTIILICGMGVLIQSAVSIGVIDSLSKWIQSNVDATMAAYLLITTSAVMSFFSSTLGVVVPTLSALVPVFQNITGAAPGFLFSILTVPALLTGYSPFSSSGAITMTGVPSEEERNRIFKFLLAAPFVWYVYFNLLVFIGAIR
ncbi:MAG: di-/tricarboxylate transporter [Peptococcaceae bacterium]|nr:di-/tricarboxylate transporter [Peptococcaceae bacterium]